ncbi:hypothetical protein HZH68_009124 [Vespula germanica]|uniref:Dipeptidylpeptidase IV N-terminal domain-containing protein n=1 Tax=Vespula germanica TaxID=30212 RepID=A0A834K224_VESGE|nr:hypothetical protein HZH68_009124 [Vespula germanica]
MEKLSGIPVMVNSTVGNNAKVDTNNSASPQTCDPYLAKCFSVVYPCCMTQASHIQCQSNITKVMHLSLKEVFSSNKALWFSPNGSKLAFGYFNDTLTPVMNIPFYGYPGSLTFQYTSAIPIHYPKSGTKNPSVKLFYVDLEEVVRGNTRLIEITHPSELSSVERILSAVSFPTDNHVYATWMNRVQNMAYFRLCDVGSHVPNCTTSLTYIEKHGWVEQFEAPLFSKDGTSFLLILPRKQKDGTDWRHLVLIKNATSGDPITISLTSGYFVVTEIVAWDQENSYVLYSPDSYWLDSLGIGN